MFKKFIYKYLTNVEKNNITNFIKTNFKILNLDLLDDTLIFLECDHENISLSNIISCICLINVKLLKYNFNKDSLYLYNFCVNEKYRNNKKGTELINYVIEFSKKYNIKYLYCSADNEISIKIFKNYNFIKEDKYYRLDLEK
jgi:ribosomal protein S18 acetylase RimI-like enzyme